MLEFTADDPERGAGWGMKEFQSQLCQSHKVWRVTHKSFVS